MKTAPGTAETAPYIRSATADNFDELVIANSHRGLVVVDFWAPWAGPSLRQGELLRRLADDYGGRFLLVAVNTDVERSVADRFGVRSLPSCRLFRHGRVVEVVRGLQPEADFRRLFDRELGGGMVHPTCQDALRRWHRGDRDGALRALAAAALERPEEPEPALLLVRLLLKARRYDEAFRVLDSMPAEHRAEPEAERLHAHLAFVMAARDAPPRAELERRLAADADDHDARYRLAAAALIGDDPAAALAQLITLLERAPGFRDGLAARGARAVLGLLDGDDPAVRKYRAALFNLLH